jgi:RNA polymerase sigma factor (sigma-70 family)
VKHSARFAAFVGWMSESDASYSEGTDLSVQRDFDAFYRSHHEELVRGLVLAVGHNDLGFEAADEAFARAVERWEDVGGYENPEGWVYRVGLNWARSRLRQRSFSLEGLFAESVHYDDLPEPELLAAVEHLSFEYRSVIVARFFLDWTIEQTAAALDIPEGTVKTRQARALHRLRKRLGARHES